MGLLLDTHVVLWWLSDAPTLDPAIKDRLDLEANVFISAATVWEVAIKQALGKLIADHDLAERVRDCGFASLAIGADHAITAGALPLHHRDPFDRMLIAQASIERLTIMTRGRQFAAYEVDIESV